MLPLVEEARRVERENPKILAVSVPVGYQYADVPQMGPSVVVVTDGIGCKGENICAFIRLMDIFGLGSHRKVGAVL